MSSVNPNLEAGYPAPTSPQNDSKAPMTPLSEAERRLLLTAATRRMGTRPESTRRIEPRYMLPPGCQVAVRTTGFIKGKQLVVTVRDISRHGLAVLHDGPVAIGTELNVTVTSADKKTTCAATGKVVRCKQVKGGVHDAGIQLDQALPMNALLSVLEKVDENEQDECQYAALLCLIENIASVTRKGGDLWTISRLISELNESVQQQMKAQNARTNAA